MMAIESLGTAISRSAMSYPSYPFKVMGGGHVVEGRIKL